VRLRAVGNAACGWCDPSELQAVRADRAQCNEREELLAKYNNRV